MQPSKIGLDAGPVQFRLVAAKLFLTVRLSVGQIGFVVIGKMIRNLRKTPSGGNAMPLIQVRVIKDVFSKEQKKEIISRLTDAMVSIEGENMRGVTWCVIEEVESGDWGIGGQGLTTSDVLSLAKGGGA
jgi:4-oxalocrotonate tautomerase